MSGSDPRAVARAAAAAILMALMFLSGAAHAQDNSETGRLRDALRRVTVQLRALQDSQGALQASLDQATQQRDALQKQLDAAKAQPAAPAPDPELARLRATALALTDQNKELQSGLQKVQAGYEQAAAVARANDTKVQLLTRKLTASDARLAFATAESAKLVHIANDILHLYRSQSFRSLLLESYEPLLGFKQVELENTVQDYEDKILDHKFDATTPVPAANSPASAARATR
jgi:chromosome segregation ATPase